MKKNTLLKKLYFLHDSFFKKALDDPKVARELILRYVPQEIIAKIDFESVKVENNNFIDNQLNKTETDVLLSAQIDNKPCYFYFLIEHQSNPDRMLPFRLESYKLKIMTRHIEKYQTTTLPIVYPLVLYAGKRPYNYSMDILDLFDENKSLAKMIYSQPPKLIDLQHTQDKDLLKFAYCGLMEFVLKHIHAQDFISRLTSVGFLIENADKGGSSSFVQAIFAYALEEANVLDKWAFKQKFKQFVQPATEDKIMTLGEQFIEEGRQEGWRIGHKEGWRSGHQMGIVETAKNMLNASCTHELIARVTGLSLSEINTLERELVEI